MEINFIENNKNRVVFELSDAGHTFCNVLKKELWNDDNVQTSAYSIEHPLVGLPRVIVEVKRGNDAKEAVIDAVDRIEKKNKDFLKLFKKAM